MLRRHGVIGGPRPRIRVKQPKIHNMATEATSYSPPAPFVELEALAPEVFTVASDEEIEETITPEGEFEESIKKDEKIFECPYCDFSSKSNRGLKIHLRKHDE